MRFCCGDFILSLLALSTIFLYNVQYLLWHYNANSVKHVNKLEKCKIKRYNDYNELIVSEFRELFCAKMGIIIPQDDMIISMGMKL